MKWIYGVPFAFAAVWACGGKTAGPSTFDGATSTSSGAGQGPTTVAPVGATVDPSCNTRTTASKRADIPRGSCVGGATCAFQTPAGLDACEPGVSGVAVVPNEWTCTCDGTWSCEIVAGGYGILTCPGWEPGRPCAMGDVCQIDSCGAGETCFTSLQCGAPLPPDAGGGNSCSRGDGAGDDTCHVMCLKDADCATGQECVDVDFWGCSDFNGQSQDQHVKSICCAVGSNCTRR